MYIALKMGLRLMFIEEQRGGFKVALRNRHQHIDKIPRSNR